MVTELERSLGFRAAEEMLRPPEGVDYLVWGDDFDDSLDDVHNPQVVGAVAVVATSISKIGDETHVLTTTNRAVHVDAISVESQKLFLKLYREFVAPLQRAFSIGGGMDKEKMSELGILDDPDYRAEIVARSAYELATQNVITLGGYVAVTFQRGGSTQYAHGLFCADSLVQNVALDFREEVMDLDRALVDYQPKSEQDKELKEVLDVVIGQTKVMKPRVIDAIGTGYIAEELPTPTELRKQLGYAPPKKKRK